MRPIGSFLHSPPSAEYNRSKLTGTQLIRKRFANHFVDRGDEYKRTAFSALENARESLPEDTYLDLRVEHDTLSVQRDELLDIAENPTSELIAKAYSYKNGSKAFYQTVKSSISEKHPYSSPSSVASSPILSHSPSWPEGHNRHSMDQMYHSKYTSTDFPLMPGQMKCIIGREQGVPNGRVVSAPNKAIVISKEHSEALLSPAQPHNDEQRSDFVEWMQMSLSSLSFLVNVSAVEDLLLSLPRDGGDDACRKCIADLLTDYGHPDGEDLVDEFIHRRSAAFAQSYYSSDTTADSLSHRDFTSQFHDASAHQYSYYRYNTPHTGEI